ncbi:MAG: Methyltransferase type 12 [Parcubacteria group bacterium GW2011_GWA1_47_11]|nr:MAG: Methyltransferase type 12 [Parcubacteria group bacterium GW2011_GWA1_47_11]
MTSSRTQSLFVAYDLEHVGAAVAHAAAGGEVLAVNLWAERALKARGITVHSYAECRKPDADEAPLMAAVQAAAREWYRIPAMRFFEHKGIPLGEALEPALEAYLARLMCYRLLFESVLDAYPNRRLIVPYPSGPVSPDAGPLTYLEARVAADAAAAAASARGLPFSTIGEAPLPPAISAPSGLSAKSAAAALYNLVAGLAPRRRVKLYVAGYWSHIAPCIGQMDDAELVLMDRGELRNIPWRQIWKHRVRLAHPRDAVSAKTRVLAAQAAEVFRKEWPAARAALAAQEMFSKIGWEQVEPALEYLVCAHAQRVVEDIEAIGELLRRERPDKVLLRVSISRYQHHFFVLARLARALGIPTVEIQHAGAYVDPRSVYSRLEAGYLASYGPYVRQWYERMGIAGGRIVPVGSPRFDRCIMRRDEARANGKQLLQDAGLDLSKPVLLVTVPEEGFSLHNDSYALADLFRTVRAAQERVPGLQVVFKFRNGHCAPEPRALVGELFGGRAVCMDKEDLFSLLCASSAAVCGNSTVIYEAMLAGVPLLLYPWRRDDTYHAEVYAPAAPILYDAQELAEEAGKVFSDSAYRAELVSRQKRFLEGYSFDGHSSGRMAKMLLT